MLNTLKENLREADYPFFTDEQLERMLKESGYDIREASYRGLIIKAECDGVNLPDIDIESSRRYWLSLASLYRRSHTCGARRSGLK